MNRGMPRTVPSNEPLNPGAMTPQKCGRAIPRIADGGVFSIAPQAKTSDGDYETSVRAACRRAGYEASGNIASYMNLYEPRFREKSRGRICCEVLGISEKRIAHKIFRRIFTIWKVWNIWWGQKFLKNFFILVLKIEKSQATYMRE